MVKKMDKERFARTIQECVDKSLIKGIGTYQEKTLHKVIKNYYESSENNQEVKVDGFVCDIKKDDMIIEVQTRSLNKLVKKLEVLLNNYKVKVVYPIPHIKYLAWLKDGEVVSYRKSPKVGSIYDISKELYKIKWFLNNPNLELTILLIDLVEYRNLDGYSKDKKRGSTRFDFIPKELYDEVVIKDYNIFVPFSDNETFTSRDYAKKTKQNLSRSQILLTILQYINVVEVVGKDKRYNLYKKTLV